MKIGQTCLYLRTITGLTQRAAAKKLEISHVHLCRIEHDQTYPSREFLDRFRKLYGVDVYVFAWCQSGDVNKLPRPLRSAAIDLSAAWKADIEKRLRFKPIRNLT